MMLHMLLNLLMVVLVFLTLNELCRVLLKNVYLHLTLRQQELAVYAACVNAATEFVIRKNKKVGVELEEWLAKECQLVEFGKIDFKSDVSSQFEHWLDFHVKNVEESGCPVLFKKKLYIRVQNMAETMLLVKEELEKD